MPNSHHPFEKVTGGKGDRDIRTDPSKYRASLFWKRSTCCEAHVTLDRNDLSESVADIGLEPMPTPTQDDQEGTLYCKLCGEITSPK